MKRTFSQFVKTAGLGLALLTLVLSWTGEPAMGAVTIKATLQSGFANALDPADAAWTSVIQYNVVLDTVISATGIPQKLPSSKWRILKVKAMHDGADIFFRYEWTDPTADTSVADTTLFADAVALQIAYGANSSIAMGNQFQPVNILFWRADLPRLQNIVSGGAGTVQTSPDSDVLLLEHSQNRAGTSWVVVMKRPLLGPATDSQGKSPGNLVTLASGKYYRTTFAQWDGGNEERNGVKLIAGSWQTLYVQ